MSHRTLYCFVALALTWPLYAIHAMAQGVAIPQFGIVPNASYENHNVDSVNMNNGNDIIRIPLFSLPQLGKLSLSFSVVANTTYWTPEENCETGSDNCTWTYSAIPPTYAGSPDIGYASPGVVSFGASIVPDNIPFVGWEIGNYEQTYQSCVDENPAYCNTIDARDGYTTLFTAYDSTGGAHPLYYDSTNLSHLRSTDGSGFLYISSVTNPSLPGNQLTANTSPSMLIDPHGIKSFLGQNGSVVQADPDNNQITMDSAGDYVDSVGRIIPPIPQATSSTAGCPNLNQSFQPAVASSVWSVPGPNNTKAKYTICYANITYRACFLTLNCVNYSINYVDGQGNFHYTEYDDAVGTQQVIQSIVLPNGTHWGFLYDAGNPNDSTDINHYGTLSQLLFPEGGSIAYSYFPYINAATGTLYPSLVVSQRTVSDANGNSYVWKYNINPSVASVSTDPNGNDTVYQYSTPVIDGGYIVRNGFLETSRKIYQGSQSSGTLLETIATNYQVTGSPVFSVGDSPPPPVYANVLVQSIKTTLADGSSTTTTKGGYAGVLSATLAGCSYDQDDPSGTCAVLNPPPVTLTYSIPTSTSITDYSGSVLEQSNSQYLWQSNNAYLGANLLDTATVTTTLDGLSNRVQQVTTSYDEPSYVSNGGTIAGHPTSVLRWNNNGSAIDTHTDWTATGMVDHTVDGNGITNASFVYGSQFDGLYPTSVKNALNQTTTYTWDYNTGKVTSVIDPNNALTSFSYDVIGRPVSVAYADGGQINYCFSDLGGANCSQGGPPFSAVTTVTATPSPTETTTFKYDGLGRIISQKMSNGSAVDTQYDGLNQVLSRTNPYISSADSTFGYNTNTYDALGRILYQCHPDNGTGSGACAPGNSYLQNVYSGNITTTYDELRNYSQRTTDALGRLTKVVEPGGLQTTYVYDTLGNLTSVKQYGNGTTDGLRQRGFSYDSLSRLLTATNSESGTVCYGTGLTSQGGCPGGYDGNGNLLYKTDARNVTTNYSYDLLNRLISKSFTNAPAGSLSSCYQYGSSMSSAVNGVGRLLSSWTQPGLCGAAPPQTGLQTWRTILSYDAIGRVTKEQQCTPGKCSVTTPNPYVLQYGYDLAGHVTHTEDGIGQASWTHQYDLAGRLINTSASTLWPEAFYPSQVFSAQNYSPANGLSNWKIGIPTSGTPALTGVKTYDNRLRVTSESVSGHE